MTKNKNIFQIPTTDFSFKRIFGTEKNKRFLIHFLNCFVSKYTGEIVDITYLNTEQYGLEDINRKAVFDILCEDTESRQFIIEMQQARQPEYAERSIFYLSRAISTSMECGISTYRILPTYSVNILDFGLPEYQGSGDCFHAVFLKNQNNEILSRKVGIFFINLCNFATAQSDVTEGMRRWLNILKNMPNMDDKDYDGQPSFFKELMDECRISKLNTMEKETYRKSVLDYEDVQRAVAYAKEVAAKDAFEKGKAEGRKEGREEALLEAARKFLELGVTLSDIAKATGLSEDQVRNTIDEGFGEQTIP